MLPPYIPGLLPVPLNLTSRYALRSLGRSMGASEDRALCYPFRRVCAGIKASKEHSCGRQIGVNPPILWISLWRKSPRTV